MKLIIKPLKYIAVALFWLLIWQALALWQNSPLLLPSPLETVKALLSVGGTEKFRRSVIFSLLRICGGFALGVAGGTLGAVLSAKLSAFDLLTSPVIKTVRAAPVASFIILAFVWLKVDAVPLFISFLMVLPIVWINVRQGIDGIDKNLLEMAEVFKITKAKQLFGIKIPAVFPSFLSASINGLGFAWKSGVAAEVICRPQSSLGGMLYDAKTYLETTEVFALTAVIIIISAVLEAVIKFAARRFTDDKV